MSRFQIAYRGKWEGRAGWFVAFAYDAETVEALKRAIPHVDRAWDAENKIWWVSKDYEEDILRMFPGFEAHLKQPSMFDGANNPGGVRQRA